jgi:hypothetical protein
MIRETSYHKMILIQCFFLHIFKILSRKQPFFNPLHFPQFYDIICGRSKRCSAGAEIPMLFEKSN